MKVINNLIIVFKSCLPLVLFCFIALVFYSEINPPYNLIAAGVNIIIGFVAFRFTYILMKRRGIIEIMTGSSATPDIDSLTPTPNSNVYKFTPKDLAFNFQQGSLRFSKGTICIWGDRKARKLNKQHEICSIIYNPAQKLLTIKFYDNYQLDIKEPKMIFETSKYIKIINAKSVKWTISDTKSSQSYFLYSMNNKSIETDSNTDWHPHKYDIGLGFDAVYLQG